MNYLAAFLLRLAIASALRRCVFPSLLGPVGRLAVLDLLDAADMYDGIEVEAARVVLADPAILRINAPGGEA